MKRQSQKRNNGQGEWYICPLCGEAYGPYPEDWGAEHPYFKLEDGGNCCFYCGLQKLLERFDDENGGIV